MELDGPAQFARRIARELPYSRATRDEWTRVLDELALRSDEAIVQQAHKLGLFAYIVWAYYDGERELPRVETLRVG